MSCREVEPVREAVYFQGNAGLQRDLEDPLQIERVLRPVVEDPPLWVREARRGRMAHRLQDPVGERCAFPALARVKTDLHPLELREHVVGEVERAVRENVALAAAEDPERSEQLVGGRDVVRLPANEITAMERRDQSLMPELVLRDVTAQDAADLLAYLMTLSE